MGALAAWTALLAAVILGGTAATYACDRRTSIVWRVPAGACIGLAAFGLIGFVLAMPFGLTPWVVAAAGVASASPLALLLHWRYRDALAVDFATTAAASRNAIERSRVRAVAIGLSAATGAIVLWRIGARTMITGAEGISTGVSHNIGDLPFHLTIINRFVYGGNFPPEHPSFAGVSFTYPYLTDFIAAMFVRAGMPVRDVIAWSTTLLALALAALLYRWTLETTGNRGAALIAPVLAFCSGGLGWWHFVTAAYAPDADLVSLLARLPRDYTITPDGEYRWGNLVTSLLVTQRGLLLGLPLAVIVFRLWWPSISVSDDEPRTERARLIAAGVIAGMLPLVHAHSFAVVLGAAACVAALSPNRWAWLPFFSWSLALGLPQVWWLAQGSGVRGSSFIAWAIGWDHGDQNVVVFWLKNTGALIPLILTAVPWRGRNPVLSRRLLIFYLPFTFCFIGPNLFRLAPWIWDNIKVLVYWFIASVPLVALVLARLWEARSWRRAVAAALFVSLTLAGGLDLWRVASGAFVSRVFDRGGIDFAGMVRERTSPRSLILHAPTYHHPIALTGRRSLMGYPGHVWSHGLDPGSREAEIKRMYSGAPDAAVLLARYGIDYVAVGWSERLQMPINEPFFEQYPLVGEAGGYRLYRVSRGER